MDEHGLARALGWVSIGAGLALVAAPSWILPRRFTLVGSMRIRSTE
jgi:hypothetical protein